MKNLVALVLLFTALTSQATTIKLDNLICSNDEGVSLNITGSSYYTGHKISSLGMGIGRNDKYSVDSSNRENFENIYQTVITGRIDADICNTRERVAPGGETTSDVVCLTIYIPTQNFKLVMTGDTAVLYTRSEDNFPGSKTRTTVLKCSENKRVPPAM